MSLKLLSTKIRKEIMRRQALHSAPKAGLVVSHYDDKVLEPEPHTLYIYTNKIP